MKKMKLIGIATASVALCGLLLAGCDHSPIRNPLQTRPQVVLGPLPELEQAEKITVLWHQRTTVGAQGYGKIRPEITPTALFQADNKGHLVAINRDNGRRLWSLNTKLKISSGPKQVGSRLLVGTKSGEVVAFDPATGAQLWVSKVSSEVLAPPQGDNNVLLVNSIDGYLTALDANTGANLWHYEKSVPALLLHGGSSPTLAQNYALAGFANGKMVALDMEEGALIWEKTITVPRGRSEIHRMVDIHATPLVLGNDVYVISYQGNLAAIDIQLGTLKWQKSMSSYRDLVADDHALYLTDQEHTIQAIDRQTGATLWKQTALDKRLITGPTLAGDYLVVGDHGGYIHLLSKHDGSLKGRYAMNKRILETPVSDGHFVYVCAANGEMTALLLNEAASS